MLGHEVAISSWAWAGNLTHWRDIPVYPSGASMFGDGKDAFGNGIVTRHARHWRADLVITLTDAWVFKPAVMKGIPWAPWTPLDHDPAPPKLTEVLHNGYGVPIAYSRFGEQKLHEAGFSPLYVPHGCDETYFEKVPKGAARKALGFPQHAFIVGMVGVNQSMPNRKSYPQCLEAFRRFNRRHKDSFLYMHTLANSSQGLNLEPLLEYLKLDPKSYRFPDRYQHVLGFSEEYLRNVYSAIDVLLSPNMGEGFGVPIIEAQACGAPVIATNFSTMPELCYFGELIKGEPFYTNQSSYQTIPTADRIHKALNTVYGYATEDYRKGSARARRGIRKDYHPDMITQKYWAPALEAAAARIGPWQYDE